MGGDASTRTRRSLHDLVHQEPSKLFTAGLGGLGIVQILDHRGGTAALHDLWRSAQNPYVCILRQSMNQRTIAHQARAQNQIVDVRALTRTFLNAIERLGDCLGELIHTHRVIGLCVVILTVGH